MSDPAHRSIHSARINPRAIKLWRKLASIILRSSKPHGRTLGGNEVPTEVYLQIFSTLSRPDLLTLLQLSRSTRRILTPAVNATLDLSVDVTAHVQLATRGIPLPIPTPLLQPTGSSHKRHLNRIGGSFNLPTIILTTPTPNVFAFTAHLILSQHDRDMCDNVSPLIMPNLISLRIRPEPLDNQLKLCAGYTSSNTCCPLIAHLRPRQLIIGGCATGLSCPADGLWPAESSQFPPPFVQHLVVLVGMLSAEASWQSDDVPVLFNLPSSLKKVSFVISLAERGWEQMARVEEFPLDDEYHLWGARQSLAARVIQAAGVDVQLVEIVGSDETQRLIIESHSPSINLKAAMRCKMEEQLLRKGRSMELAKATAEAITFVDEDSFRQREEWYGEGLDPLDPEEAGDLSDQRRKVVKNYAWNRCDTLEATDRCLICCRENDPSCFFCAWFCDDYD